MEMIGTYLIQTIFDLLPAIFTGAAGEVCLQGSKTGPPHIGQVLNPKDTGRASYCFAVTIDNGDN